MRPLVNFRLLRKCDSVALDLHVKLQPVLQDESLLPVAQDAKARQVRGKRILARLHVVPISRNGKAAWRRPRVQDQAQHSLLADANVMGRHFDVTARDAPQRERVCGDLCPQP